jgi:hypothetical protein
VAIDTYERVGKTPGASSILIELGDPVMTSHKQLVANRATAQRSTGPKSAIGKARSRINAWKHGLSAGTLVVGDEDPADFDRLRAAFEEEFCPQTELEFLLVERAATLMWRLRRVPAFEAVIIQARKAKIEGDPLAFLDGVDEDRPERNLGAAIIVEAHMLEKLCRYDGSIMAAFTKTLQMLFLLQNKRIGENDNGAVETVVSLSHHLSSSISKNAGREGRATRTIGPRNAGSPYT